MFIEGLKSRRPGHELDDDACFQFVETPDFDDPDTEYPRIMQMGWDAWYAEHLMKIQHPPMTDPGQLGARFGEFVAITPSAATCQPRYLPSARSTR